jgi:outer membrane receptor for Fe3+-dicitrate
LDFAAHYRIPHEKTGVGNIALAANANYTMSYEFQGAPSLGRYNYAGFFTQGVLGAQGNIPDYTLHASLTWDYAGLSYTATAHYIPGVDAPGNLWPTTGSAVNDFTVNGQVWKVPDYWTLDMQIAYEFGKGKTERKWYDGTRIAFGVNNVMDEDPPFIAGSTEDNTDKASYDILGRFVYFEVSKKF